MKSEGSADALFATPSSTGALYSSDKIKVLLNLSDREYYNLTACQHDLNRTRVYDQ
jgi:hypothetical protein